MQYYKIDLLIKIFIDPFFRAILCDQNLMITIFREKKKTFNNHVYCICADDLAVYNFASRKKRDLLIKFFGDKISKRKEAENPKV